MDWKATAEKDEAERLERMAVNVKVATVLGSVPAFSDTVESEGRQYKNLKSKKTSVHVCLTGSIALRVPSKNNLFCPFRALIN